MLRQTTTQTRGAAACRAPSRGQHRAMRAPCPQQRASRVAWCSALSKADNSMQLADGGMAAAHATAPTASSSGDAHQQAAIIAVPLEPAPAAQQQQGQGGFSIAGVLLAAAVAAGLVFKKLKSNDPFARDYMRSINTMQTDELDPELIAQARARRSRERANHRLDLDDIELPDNHPWATRKPVTAEQEAAIQARLQVRPRRAGGAGGEPRPGPRTQQLGRD